VSVRVIDPLSDGRWDQLVARHPRSSAFHRRGWLEALARTYGYCPMVLTSAADGQPLTDGVALCHISSWMTGTRLVSLPFADHCEPLVDEVGESPDFMSWLRRQCDSGQCRYVEFRPLQQTANACRGLLPDREYCFHALDIRANLEQIFRGFHKDSIQRRIRRAEREGLSYEAGRSEPIVDEFYRLLLMTKRRHHILPQPRAWFSNLIRCMGDNVQVRLARKHGTSIAAMLTLRHRTSVIYKYGCSDVKFHNLGGMPFLFWNLIRESKASGAHDIDFGRSDLHNESLIVFKDRFGTARKMLRYFRYPQSRKSEWASWGNLQAVRRIVSILPDAILPAAGGMLYRHIG
jgi:CelD/BcsL family acetyltransferase involved in cellulose biosynthesis